MAIYHLEAKVVSRGAGRSAVAASAYHTSFMLCEFLFFSSQSTHLCNTK